MLKYISTSGAGVHRHRHVYKRLGDFIGRGRLAVAEQPRTRLAAATLELAASPALRERSRLSLSAPLGLGVLLLQLFVGRLQPRNLLLQSLDQRYQVIVRVDSLHIIACRSTRQLLVVFSHDGCKNCRYWLDISETQCCPTDGVHLIALGRVCKLNWGG